MSQDPANQASEATPAEDLLEVNAAEQILRRISFDTSKAPSVIGSAFLSIREDRLCFLDTLTFLTRPYFLSRLRR